MRAPTVSLRRQLILWNALTLTVLLIALGLVTRFAARGAILQSVDRSLEERTHPPHRPGPPNPGPPDGSLRPGQDGPESPPREGGRPGPPPPEDVNDLHHPRFFDAQGRALRPGGGAAVGPWRPRPGPAGAAGVFQRFQRG